MNLTCNLARDLAELYHENLVSPETADAIRAHLKTCTHCRNYYQEYKNMQRQKAAVMPVMPPDMDGAEQKLCENLSRKLRRRRFWHILVSSAVIGAGSVMLTVGLLLTLNREVETS